MTSDRDDREALPEGVIDADPPGGWESAATADGETDERERAAEGPVSLADSGLPVEDADRREPDPQSATGEPIAAPDGPAGTDPHVESAEIAQGLDPDLVTDEQSER